MAKPASKLNWVPSDDPLKIIEPSTALKNAGYLPLEKPTYQNFNWFLNLQGKWIDYLEETTDALLVDKVDTPDDAGAANQVLALNDAGTDTEWKSIAATGPITITHAVGLVTIAMPAATGEAAGYVTTTTQDFAGNKYFLDNVTIDGSLTVTGSLVYLNVENLQVEDKNIEINFGGSTATADGAGLSVLGDAGATLATIKYDGTLLRSKWKAGPTGSEAELLRAGDVKDADIAADANLSGSKIAAASASVPGVVTTGDQTFAGRKSGNGFLPAGMIMPFAGASAPTGWLTCDGSEVAQATYPDLFAAIGTAWNTAKNPLTGATYGAPSAGNFRLPDLRSAFLRGAAAGANSAGVTTSLGGFQADTTAKNGLATSASTVSGSITAGYTDLSHTHDQNYPNSTVGGSPRGGSDATITRTGYFNANFPTTGSNVSMNHTHTMSHSLTAPAQTLTGDAETRPDNVGVNFLIKT